MSARKPYVAPAVLAEFTGVQEENPFFILSTRRGTSAICSRCATIVATTHIDGHNLDMHASKCTGTLIAEARAAAQKEPNA